MSDELRERVMQLLEPYRKDTDRLEWVLRHCCVTCGVGWEDIKSVACRADIDKLRGADGVG
jgi:hypothetical protein